MIVVFGSLNLDLSVAVEHLPAPGETVRGPGYGVHPGGKGANQALAARRAGAAVALVARCGRDAFAGLALAELRGAGVGLSALAEDAAPTGCALIAVDRRGENQIVVASGANEALRAGDLPEALLGPDRLLLLQMEVPPAESRRAAERMREAGGRVLLNLAPAAPLPAETLPLLDWLVVNEGEARTLAGHLGCRDEPAALAARCGCSLLVTLGADGALAVAGGRRWRVGALAVEARDTTAAGDAFVGVFAAALDAGRPLPEALRRASVAGGLACTRPGAQPSLPTAAEIEAALPRLAPAEPMEG
ncbi:ribokinase [Tistlia consotensis]|uniref:Ribokinase n=1 Tax=Tistlia consotensis USBA 355 TaxID=560819 RepID=A0A1Y6B528_9PROT|nr:ribokinase [Tistlia consotensis USBA 355]SNR26371.1 ribokinase [Tistlia consotensis]